MYIQICISSLFYTNLYIFIILYKSVYLYNWIQNQSVYLYYFIQNLNRLSIRSTTINARINIYSKFVWIILCAILAANIFCTRYWLPKFCVQGIGCQRSVYKVYLPVNVLCTGYWLPTFCVQKNTRHRTNSNFNTPLFNNSKTQKCYLYEVIPIWNRLPKLL